ncbi:hypothetical protein M427DRAFT_468489 [Gonapodya prolifera JEL478]|uniref:Uncharacterized protein n=1 Tax=Gonapodya prolifera (strain JEL478) TaxID=1344416 RepID=A0A139AQR3_GONPJ|nr:hypothetical protein M427DRAFT_468489 [Gonapodya prolifera JEL478]|eukprot:KXS19068.1 hypothetical protein M427DRAFT_468489 [Gonapodya prolifera JEL478]
MDAAGVDGWRRRASTAKERMDSRFDVPAKGVRWRAAFPCQLPIPPSPLRTLFRDRGKSLKLSAFVHTRRKCSSCFGAFTGGAFEGDGNGAV